MLRIDVIEEGKAPALLAFDDVERVTFGAISEFVQDRDGDL